MALKWNDLDDVQGKSETVPARIIVASVDTATDQGGGNAVITISLVDSNRRLYSHVPNEEVVLDILVGDNVTDGESFAHRWGNIVGGGGLITTGQGTAHCQIIPMEPEVSIMLETTAARPSDAYIFISQGWGSCYLVRSSNRWAKLTFGVN